MHICPKQNDNSFPLLFWTSFELYSNIISIASIGYYLLLFVGGGAPPITGTSDAATTNQGTQNYKKITFQESYIFVQLPILCIDL